jgi:hypothetical protein
MVSGFLFLILCTYTYQLFCLINIASETEYVSFDGEKNKSPCQCNLTCGLIHIEKRLGNISLFVFFIFAYLKTRIFCISFGI